LNYYHGITLVLDYNSARVTMGFGNGLGKSTANRQSNYYSTTIPLNSWNHVAATFTDFNNFVIYFNGSVLTRTSTSGTASFVDFTRGVTAPGLTWGYNFNYFTIGETDQMAVWSRALSQPDIATLYNSGSGLAYTSW